MVENEEKAEGWWKTHFPPRSVQPFGHACLFPPLLPLPFRFRNSWNTESWTKTRSQEWEYRKQGEFLKIDIGYTNNAEDKHVTSIKFDLPSSKKICQRPSNISLLPFFSFLIFAQRYSTHHHRKFKKLEKQLNFSSYWYLLLGKNNKINNFSTIHRWIVTEFGKEGRSGKVIFPSTKEKWIDRREYGRRRNDNNLSTRIKAFCGYESFSDHKKRRIHHATRINTVSCICRQGDNCGRHIFPRRTTFRFIAFNLLVTTVM